MPSVSGVLRLRGFRRGGDPGDRGAVAVLVAVLLASGLLLGFGALTVDVGLMYAERAELQSGADAAALAIAKVCADHSEACNQPQMLVEAETFAEDNARDGLASVLSVCGRVSSAPGPIVGQPIAGCSDDQAGNITDCLGEPPAGDYVEVRTATLRADGNGGNSTLLPPAFAGAVTGTDGYTIGACARASWEQTVPIAGLSMVVSDCRFSRSTADGRELADPPAGGQHRADREDELILPFRRLDHFGRSGRSDPRDCGDRARGRDDAHDGFTGRLSGDTGLCEQQHQVGEERTTVGGEDGFWRDCLTRLTDLAEEKSPVAVATYDEVDWARGSRDDDVIEIKSVRNFVVTGWHRSDRRGPADPDDTRESPLTGRRSCERFPTDSCLFGYFTTDPVGGTSGPASISITG